MTKPNFLSDEKVELNSSETDKEHSSSVRSENLISSVNEAVDNLVCDEYSNREDSENASSINEESATANVAVSGWNTME